MLIQTLLCKEVRSKVILLVWEREVP